MCKDQTKGNFLSHKVENIKRLISDHKVSEIKICLTTLEIVLIYKTLWLKKFLINLSKLNKREVSNMDVSIRKVKTAAADSPRLFFTALGYSKDQSDSMSSC